MPTADLCNRSHSNAFAALALTPTLVLLLVGASAVRPVIAQETDDLAVPSAAAGPADLPPPPRGLPAGTAGPQLPPPYPLPSLAPPAPEELQTDDEPLWVLPPSVVPERLSTLPGADPVRDLGYLDRPGMAARVVTEPIERNLGQLEQGLDWAYCGPRPGTADGGDAAGLVTPPAQEAAVELEAGGIAYRRRHDLVDAVGNVIVVRGEQRVEADQLSYDRRSEVITSPGATYLAYPQLRLAGAGAEINLATEQGRIDAPRFRLSGPLNARGLADTAYVVTPRRTAYRDIVYTTCPPGSNAWSLRADKLKLDQQSGLGIARDARLKIRGVPVFYTPYLQFPIDDRRRSGLLVPSFGSSEANGLELELPYYWNIAPNMDATITPRFLSERGLVLGGEFRYLTRADSGVLRAEVLPDDRSFDEGDRLRWAFGAEQQGRWLDRLYTSVDFSAVSDDDYLEDLGNGIDATSTRRLEQRAGVTYAGQGWSLATQLSGFQTLDDAIAPANRPYGRLPQVLFRINPRELLPRHGGRYLGRPTAGLDAEYNFFDHNHLVHGQRFTLTPLLTWPLRRSYGHLIPTARLYLARYDLTDTPGGVPDDPGHAIPSLDVDGKLIFERPANWFGTASIQTLEPRLYYLYTPFEDQSDTPVFDSSELDFGFANLFRSNRFTGRDRIGDANQVTAGVSSRLLDGASGAELFRLSLGQIYYFADRRVQIREPVQTQDRSPYAGELSARLFDNWFGRASFEWDPEADTDDAWQRRTLRLEYRDAAERVMNLAYRTDLTAANPENRYEDTDMSFRLPFGEHMEMVGRWLYSVRHNETMDAVAGVAFGQCCWRLRLVGRHFKRRPGDAASTSVMLQLELAGLGAVGDPVGDFLEREIYGYNN
jgi:LPS-assembly protein